MSMKKFDPQNEKHIVALRGAIHYTYELELLSQSYLMKAIGGVAFFHPQNEKKVGEKRAALERLAQELKTVSLHVLYEARPRSHEIFKEKIVKVVASTFLPYSDLTIDAAVWLREREHIDPLATVADMLVFERAVREEARHVARTFRFNDVAFDNKRLIKVKLELKKHGVWFRFVFDVTKYGDLEK